MRAVGLIAEARWLLPGHPSLAAHKLRAEAALMMADAWSSVGDWDAAKREIKRARGHASAVRGDGQPTEPGLVALTESWRQGEVLDLKAKLASAYISECTGNPRGAMAHARGVAKLGTAPVAIAVSGVARWIAAALKYGSLEEAAKAEDHFRQKLGPAFPRTRVPSESRALLIRWMSVFRVRLGELDAAEDLLGSNAEHYETCRRCALLDQLVSCHIAASYGDVGHRKLARELLAGVRKEAEHERGILAPILFFEQHVLEHLDL